MSLVVFASAKGAPGVTTTALAVGALWPRPVLVADVDPSGGDIAFRLPRVDGLGLDPDRGVIALAAAARRGLRPEQISDCVQTVVGGLDVLVGVRNAEQCRAVSTLWPTLAPALDALPGVDVIADCGRLGADSAHDAMLRAACYVVLLCRPTVTSVMAVRDRLGALATTLRPYDVNGTPIGVLVVADENDTRGVAGVRDALDRLPVPIPVIGQIAYDPKGAAVFEGHAHARPHRTMLVRSARHVAATLAASIAPFGTAAAVAAAAPDTAAQAGAPAESSGVQVGAPVDGAAYPTPEFAAGQSLRHPEAIESR